MRIISLCLVLLSLQFVRPAVCSATSHTDAANTTQLREGNTSRTDAANTTPKTTVSTSPILTGADQMNLYLPLLHADDHMDS